MPEACRERFVDSKEPINKFFCRVGYRTNSLSTPGFRKWCCRKLKVRFKTSCRLLGIRTLKDEEQPTLAPQEHPGGENPDDRENEGAALKLRRYGNRGRKSVKSGHDPFGYAQDKLFCAPARNKADPSTSLGMTTGRGRKGGLKVRPYMEQRR